MIGVRVSTPEIHEVTPEAEGASDAPVPARIRNIRLIGMVAGVVGAVIMYNIFPAELSADFLSSLTDAEIETDRDTIAFVAAIAVLMGVWWMTEAIPLAATALIPLVAFPFMEIAPMGTVGASYGSPTIFLFMGGFFLALTMQRWNLHVRIALRTVLLIGTKPKRLILGFMVATGFLSMWISNTATAVMMLPIGISVLALVGTLDSRVGKDSKFGTALMLGIAYAASIASLSTLIGTPPNTLLRGYLQDNHDITLSFGTWMLFATPLAWGFLLIAWWLLTKIYMPEIDEIPGGKELITEHHEKLGPMSLQEKMTMVIFIAAALSWILVPTLFEDLPITDEMIAMILALVLFLVPAKPKEGIGLLNWETAKNVPWDVLLLFGGGLALSAAFGYSGLSLWIGDQASGLAGLPTIVIVLAITTLVIFLTEMTSNTATAAAFLPIIGGVAIGMGVDVELLVIPVALAATCAFMLPVATPPNAIAYGSGYIKIGQMIKVGIWLNLIGIVLITLFTMFIGPAILGYGT
ncbi:DASS family sodium-coupled anion symporter [Flaviflexus sp. JY899]|uniref:Sodium-dependent dicarboxylate transporter SdcS n=1 Tax=Flaviflexus equikiangi TaxID=2758573 RepID=A0ABS2TIG1_9ACTO|nr:DASS family sodium-coupled anion symporter [Flaviflexus equikiangi]